MTPRRAAGLLLLLAALAPARAPADAPWVRTPPPAPLPAAPVAPPVVKEGFLPTGLRVVVVEHHQRPIVVTRLVLPRGALFDPPASGGAAWLAVAIATDFHERSPTGDELVEEKSFRRQVVELGGAASFDVASDFSILGIEGYAQDTGAYLKMIAEALARPRRGEDSYRGRRDALLDELEDLETADPRALGRVLAEAAFGAGHPYARSLVGTATSLGKLGLEDVIAVQDALLSPEGATLLVVGDVSAPRAFDEAKAAFGRWRRAGRPSPAVAPASGSGERGEVGFLRRQPAATLVACASRPLGELRASDAALDVLATILGGSVGSRLNAALREQGGLTYGAGAEILRRRWARAFLACAPLAAAEAERGVRAFREALDGARDLPPSEDEVRRAVAIRLGALEGRWDDAAGIADAWTEAIALGRARPRPDEERAELERVTVDEVRTLARALLRPGTLRWIVSGEPRAARAVEGTGLGRLRALTLER